jgi:chromosome partitioning protein
MKTGITNLKGGVGKTTISLNLAVCFAHMGYKVCIVDTDTNQNSLQWLGVRDAVLPDILVAGSTGPKAINKVADNLHTSHDIVILDGTPNLSEMTTRIMMASDLLLIPTRPGAHDFRAMNEFIERYNQVKDLKEDIPAYFLINEYNERINIHKTIKDSLKKHYETPVLKTVIKSRTAYGEANMLGMGVYEYADRQAKQEMVMLTKEIISVATKHKFIKKR